MNPHENDDTDRRMSLLMTAAGLEGVLPDEAFLARLRQESAVVFDSGCAAAPSLLREFRIAHPRVSRWLVPLAAAAVIGFTVTFVASGSKPAYAWQQTLQAIETVRFMHIREYGQGRQVEGEWWMEFGPNGDQIHYRQDTPELCVVEDGSTVMAHHKDQDTVVLHDPGDRKYHLMSNPRRILQDLAGDGSVTIEEDSSYRGVSAHRVRLFQQVEVYVDPSTRLPLAAGGIEFSFEKPGPGTFDVVFPKGVAVVDKRSRTAPPAELDRMQHEAYAEGTRREAWEAVTQGDWPRANRLLANWVKGNPNNSWAWFFLGRSQYETGNYDAATESFTRAIDTVVSLGGAQLANRCYLARGFAYRQKGLEQEAKNDFGRALGEMISALRHPDGAMLYDYADCPGQVYRDQFLSREFVFVQDRLPADQSFQAMIARLQKVTGRNFTCPAEPTPEEKELVIATWQCWWSKHATEYGVTAAQDSWRPPTVFFAEDGFPD